MNRPDVYVSPELAERLAAELAPGERLVWLGQPRADLAVRAAYFLVPFGIVFTLFSLVWIIATAWLTYGLMSPCGLPFVVVGGAMIGSPIWLRSQAQKTVYALTDRRAIIRLPGWFGRVTVQSFTAAGLGQMTRTERPDGAGDLIFQVYTTGTGDDTRTVRRGFAGIDRVREVEELVRATLQRP